MLNIVNTTPTILTDSIFEAYGGEVGNTTPGQRNAAYAIAEGQAAQEIGTFISPTTHTGTYSWPHSGQVLKLDFDRVISVSSVTAIHDAGCDCAEDAIELSGCAWIKSSAAGILDVRECGDTVRSSCSGCNCGGGGMIMARVVCLAGLPSTAATDPRLLMALSTAADLALQQIIDPHEAEGGPGDTGVQSFSTLSYSETRTPLKLTAFGSSARANYAAQMISHFKNKSALRL
jgi:hypothetical protein